MAKIKGVCKNYDLCTKADNKEVQEVERSAKFVCQNPECGKPLQEIKGKGSGGKGGGGKGPKPLVLIAIAVVILGVIGAGAYFIFGGSGKQPTVSISPEDPTVQVDDMVKLSAKSDPEDKKIKWNWSSSDESIATVSKTGMVTGTGAGSVTITATDEKSKASASVTVTVSGETKTEPVVEPEVDPQPEVQTPAEEPKVQPVEKPQEKPTTTSGPARKTITYSFGKYEGETVNGIPQGQGTMTYTCNVQIAKAARTKYCAEKGDIFVGSWYNGDIEHGELRSSDNVLKASISNGRRPNAYNLSNDKCGCD